MGKKANLLRAVALMVGCFLALPAYADTSLQQRIGDAVAARQYPLAEELLGELLANQPGNLEARFLLARIFSWDGKTAESLTEYDRLLATAPNDVDYLLGKAQTLMWAQRPKEALPLLVQARQLRPDYADVWRTEIRALAAVGGDQAYAQAMEMRAEAMRRFPQEDWGLAALAVPPAAGAILGTVGRTQVEAGYSQEHLTNGYDPWHSNYVWASHSFGDRSAVYGNVSATDRFRERDTEVSAGWTVPLSSSWSGTVEGAFSPEHHVLARWSMGGLLAYSFGNGWGASAGLRRTRYNDTAASLTSVGMERYWGNYRVAYTITESRLDKGGSAVTHKVQGNYYYGDRSNIGLALVAGQEVATGLTGPYTSDVRSLIISAVHWLTPRWAISPELLVHEQGDSYTREGIRVGVRYLY